MLKIREAFLCLSVWAVMKADLFLLPMDILCCFTSEARPDLISPTLFSSLLPLLAFPWCTGSQKQLSGNFQWGGWRGLLKDEDNLWIPSLLPPFDDFVNIRLQCLVCSAAQNIWRGAQPSFLLQPYYVYINGINSWERIFLFSQPITSVDFFFFKVLAEPTESIIEKVVGKKEKDFDVQMAPNKEFCSVNSRFCCDVISSKCILGYQTKTVQNSWFEMLNMVELLCVPKASPWYPAKSQLIMRSPSQIAWPWELVKSGFTKMKLFPPARKPGEYSLPRQRA